MKKKKTESVSLRRLNKNSIKEMNQTEAQGWVVQRAIELEQEINSIITYYFNPSNKSTFTEICLNSSVMHFGGKLKVLRAIGIDNSVISKLQQLASIRNAFAHSNMNYTFSISYGGDIKKPTTSTRPNISVMNSNGEIKSKDPYEYLVEYLGLYNDLIPVLQIKSKELRTEIIEE